MPKFRGKPVVISAEQYTGPASVPDGQERPQVSGLLWKTVGLTRDWYPYVVTAHGQVRHVAPGDWVIPEPDGSGHYAYKPEFFALRYEPI